MNNGGVIARIGYRYQDECALYFLMHEYMSGSDFEIFYSELDEIDFETQHSDYILSYQAKTNGKLSAEEVNNLIKKHQLRVQNFNKKEGKIVILSESNLQKSLQHLIVGSWNNKSVEKYCLAALANIDRRNLVLKNRDFSRREIKNLSHGLINEYLKKLNGDDSYDSGIVDKLATVLLGKIIEISCEHNEIDRSLNKDKISEEIFRFTKNITWRNGRKRVGFPPIPNMPIRREVVDTKLEKTQLSIRGKTI